MPSPGVLGADLPVRVEGVRELSSALRKIDKDLPKQIRDAAKAAAGVIASEAARRYTRRYRIRSGRTVRTIKARATQRSARITFGSKRIVWDKGQEFGSDKFPPFAPWTGKGPGGVGSKGRFLFPAARDHRAAFADDIERRFGAIARANLRGIAEVK